MQAPLSNTASGKTFRNRPSTAPSTHLLHHRVHLPETVHDPGLQAKTTATRLSESSGLAHDAGNLLGALGLYCELLASPGVLRDEHRHYAEELQMLSGRSRDLIDRLLNPGVTRRRMTVPPERSIVAEQVVVPDVIEGCRGLLNAVARRAVAVAYGAGAALPVAISREALERILVNLTKNAAEAMDTDIPGAITLRVICNSAADSTRRIVLTVEDKGRGLSSAAVKVLMAQSMPGTAKTALRGLGFQVVRELVGASGGKLRLKSEDEKSSSGTTVEVTWAVAEIGTHGTSPFAEREMTLATVKQAQPKALTARSSC